MITKDSSNWHVMCWFSEMLLSFVTTLCSPNEDFGRPHKHFRTRVRSTLQRFVAQIMYSRPWKVPRKRVLKGLFGLPKSSFGRGKLCKMIQKIVATMMWCVGLPGMKTFRKPRGRMSAKDFHKVPGVCHSSPFWQHACWNERLEMNVWSSSRNKRSRIFVWGA